ncbi:uncharacterized protein LOC100401380 isoform X7 [Callithrix jacchus]|uniref:uncharacterized protein LOC100401380 isoform X3 n=1 Tax=Callithrix jacchus TaxID=9483 RepID=UPI0023DD317A|nr:uncharacterized protein LOC100401380 isoform X3 [Callithrix jacchus]
MPPSTPGTLPSTPLAPNNCCARMTAAEVRRWRYRERVAGAASRGRDAGAARLGPPPRGRCGWRRKVQGQGPGRRRPRGWRCPGRSWRCGGKREKQRQQCPQGSTGPGRTQQPRRIQPEDAAPAQRYQAAQGGWAWEEPYA